MVPKCVNMALIFPVQRVGDITPTCRDEIGIKDITPVSERHHGNYATDLILLSTPLMWHVLSTQRRCSFLMNSSPPMQYLQTPQLSLVQPSHSPHRRALKGSHYVKFTQVLPL